MLLLKYTDPLAHYQLPHPIWHQSLTWLEQNASQAPEGIHKIDGDSLFAKVMTYDTKPRENCFFEAHKTFVDLQLVTEGCEFIDVFPANSGQRKTPYDRETDISIFEPAETYSTILLEGPQIAILFPEDAHRPQIQVNSPTTLRKVVLKIAVAYFE